MAEQKKEGLAGLLQSLPQIMNAVQQFQVQRQMNRDPIFARDFIMGRQAKEGMIGESTKNDYMKLLGEQVKSSLEDKRKKDKDKEESIQDILSIMEGMEKGKNPLEDLKFQSALAKRGLEVGSVDLLKLALGKEDDELKAEKTKTDIEAAKQKLSTAEIKDRLAILTQQKRAKQITAEEYRKGVADVTGVPFRKMGWLEKTFGRD